VKSRRAAAVAAVLAAVAPAVLVPSQPVEAAAVKATVVQMVNLSAFSPNSADPTGITYVPSTGRFLTTDSETDETRWWQGKNLWEMKPDGTQTAATAMTAYTKEPTGLSFDPRDGTLYVSDDNRKRVSMVKAGSDGQFGTPDDTVTGWDTTRFSVDDPTGVAMDTGSGDLFLAGGTGRNVVRVSPGPDRKFGGSDDVGKALDMSRYGVKDAEGVGYDDVRGTLVVLDVTTRLLYEIDRAGALLGTIDIAVINPLGGGDVAIAPASNAAGKRSYWVVLRGVDDGQDPNENDGKLYELSVDGGSPGPVANTAPSVTITSPTGGSTFTTADTVTFKGTAVDAESGDRTPLMTWKSSRDGSLGTGGSVAASLSEGSHTITATATDPQGVAGSASITVVVGKPSAPGGSVAAQLLADATIAKKYPKTNYGGDPSVTVDKSPLKQFLLKFRVTGLEGKTVKSATLRLVNMDSSDKGGDVRRYPDTSWIETGQEAITWSRSSQTLSPILASFGAVSKGATYELSLPASVINAGGFVSLQITTGSTSGAGYWSKEHGAGLAPQLIVVTD
jgi:Big-like domain-containing protein